MPSTDRALGALVKRGLAAAALAAGMAGSVPAAAQTLSTPTAASDYGVLLSPDRGPWVIGEVRFSGNTAMSESDLLSKVRARRGNLYMPEDVAGDLDALRLTGGFVSVSAREYAIPNQPVPADYASLSASPNMVRLVFTVSEKVALPIETAIPVVQAPPPPPAPPAPPVQASTAAPKAPPGPPPPAPVSGVVLTPTAYRGFGALNEPGLGLDFNGVYYIGRLYGKNNLNFTTERTNYLDRIGLWLLSVDGKLQLQSEGTIRPAMAAGGQGYFMFRDSPQPSITTPGVSVTVSGKSTKVLSDAYIVFSKNFHGVRSSLGYMQGNFGDLAANLTEFLSPESFTFNGEPGRTAQSKSVLFANILILPRKEYPLAVEFLKPEGMARGPFLLNFKIGYFLHLNFDLSYLRYQGGYDLLGVFQFRTNYFPRR